MWNAIQINGKWYALDDMDDTDGKQKNSKEQYQYFLKEKTFFSRCQSQGCKTVCLYRIKVRSQNMPV